MKKIDYSSITTLAGMPFKVGSLQHMQESWQEGIQQMAIPIIGQQYNTANYFIMQGCKNTGSGSNYIISAGSIYHNNEWFLVDATTFTAGVGQTAVGIITTTYFTSSPNADPTVFTDGNIHNVNAIRKIVFSSGVSGSGDVDFSNLKPIGLEKKHIVNSAGEPSFSSPWTNVGVGTQDTYFRKDWSNNIIYLGGVAVRPGPNSFVAGVSQTLYTLPSSEYYPPSAVQFSINENVTGTPIEIYIDPLTGDVKTLSMTTIPIYGARLTFEGMCYSTV